MMNDKQFESLNHIMVFGIICCLLFTAGNVAIYNITLKGQMQDTIDTERWRLRETQVLFRQLGIKYDSLEKAYLNNLFEETIFHTVHVFKDEYLNETHVAVSIYWSHDDAQALQWAIDHGHRIIGRGDFIIRRPIIIRGDNKWLQDLRLWGGGILYERPEWYNESEPWYDALGEQINKTTGLPIEGPPR